MNVNKKGLYFTLLIFVIGVMICFGVLIASEFDFSKFSTDQNIEKKEINLTITDIEEFQFIIDNASINVTESSDDQLHITYYESNKLTYEVTTTEGKVVMQQIKSMKWYDYIGINFFNESINIKIPISFTKSLHVTTDNSTIDFKNLTHLDSITANTKNATIDFDYVTTTNDIYCKTTNSVVEVNEVTCANLTVLTTNSEVNIEDATISDKLICETSSGIIYLDNVIASSIDAKNDNGMIDINDIVANNIILATTNGIITGNIIGNKSDYKITSSVTNGMNNLPSYKADGDKYLEVSTSNGMIDIDFK
ncbi:MAG: DUF4097 family beta strand repeat-containing protein [Bacilli bacterium]|nr:DUF4097 family beta strand repeat-containing protein [Bacilli bacterium]